MSRYQKKQYTQYQLRQFSSMFHAGGVFAYPTESVYGLGCDPWNEEATSHLLTLKQRDIEKGVILIAANLEQLLPFLKLTDHSMQQCLQMPQSQAVTWIAPVSDDAPNWIKGKHESIAVRITTFQPVIQLCNAVKVPLISTSANRSGHRPAKNALAVRRIWKTGIDWILPGQTGGAVRPSEIRELATGKILRAGG